MSHASIGWMGWPQREQGFFCAADRDQAALTAAAIDEWVHRTEGLAGLVVVERDRVRFPHHRVVMEIMSSDAPSAWGRRGHFWVIDELASWADVPSSLAFYEAISTSWPKEPSARVCITTTAGSPAHFSRAVYEQACTEESWVVFDSHDVAPWLNAADVEAERRRLSAGSFARLWENRWTEAEDHLVTSENLARCVTLTDWPLKPKPNTNYVIGVDVGVKNDNTAITVGHTERRDSERHVVLDALEVYKPRHGTQVPLAEVEHRVETLAKRYGGADVHFDPSQALSMVQALNARGVRVEEQPITARWNDSMCTLLHTMLRDGLIDLPDEPELLDELRSVRVVETSQGLLSVDSTPGRHDDQVDAIGIVAMELTSRPATVGNTGSIFTEMPRIPRRGRGLDHLAERPYNPLTDDPWERARWQRT
jgi:phage terminase large subunit-like protein